MIDAILSILTLYFYQMILSVGLIVFLGLLISLVNRLFFWIIGSRYAYRAAITTGFLGTPVHELGHALFCLVFFHKIVEMKLFIPNTEDGTLGYVSHSYNPKNIYHQIGNFFIGIGPIILGSVCLMLLMLLLIPAELTATFALFDSFESEQLSLASIVELLVGIFTTIFSTANFTNILWWIFIVLSMSIALHMRISVPDIQSSKKGFVYLALFVLIADIILSLVGLLLPFSYGFILFGAVMLNFLLISLIMSAILLGSAALLKLILSVLSAIKK